MVAPDLRLAGQSVVARLPAWDPRLLWAALGLVGALLLGALLIAFADRWRKRPSEEQLQPRDQLAHFRTLYEDGQLSAEEFNRIRGLLTDRIMKELDLPAAAPLDPKSPAPSVEKPASQSNS